MTRSRLLTDTPIEGSGTCRRSGGLRKTLQCYNKPMYIAILGRQPEISLAELNALGGSATKNSDQTALIQAEIDINRLGGSQKLAKVIDTYPDGSWSDIQNKVIDHYQQDFAQETRKITLGFSVYDWPRITGNDVQKLGLGLKRRLKNLPSSQRILPSKTAVLPTASSLHNKLGSAAHKREIIIIKGYDGQVTLAETIAVQNLDAYTRRDQRRPKRDAFVGMLPPKLAQIMINLAVGDTKPADGNRPTVLDPFCGTGVLLQEAALMGFKVYGTDLSDKMIDYSSQNLEWLEQSHRVTVDKRLNQADAMDAKWQLPVDYVVCETYLGQPFSAPPSPKKLREVVDNCDHIIGKFLQNISNQVKPGTKLCVAIPAWRSNSDRFTHLPLTNRVNQYGFEQLNDYKKPLLYFRQDQVVARQLLVLVKK